MLWAWLKEKQNKTNKVLSYQHVTNIKIEIVYIFFFFLFVTKSSTFGVSFTLMMYLNPDLLCFLGSVAPCEP